MPIPFVRRPYSPRDDRITDLLMEQGRAAAAGAARSGDIWSGAVHGLGQQAAGAVEAMGMAKRDAAWVSYVKSGEWQKDPQAAYATARKIWGPEGDRQFQALMAVGQMGQGKPEDNLKRLGFIIGAADRMKDPARAVLWPELHALGQRALPDVQIPAQYDPAFWTEVVSPLGAQIRGEKPAQVGTREVTVTNPDGSKTTRIVKDEPGQTFESAAPVKEPKLETRGIDVQAADALARGDTETYNRLLKVKKEMGQADDRPRETAVADAQRKRLVEAVIANPNLWDDLTPSVKGDIAADLNGRGFAGFGKGLPQPAITKIAEAKSAVDSLTDLRAILQKNEQYIGPIAGLSALNPYSEARKAQADIDRVRQRVGKALEGGVLRKEDEEKYKKILSTLTDESSTAIYKVDQMIRNLENDLSNYIEEQRAAGRRVSTGVTNRQAPPERTGTAITVTAPNGKVYQFKSKAEADVFKKRAGIQ